VDLHVLATEEVLQPNSTYENILARVRTVARQMQERIRHTMTEYDITPPQGLEGVSDRGLDSFRG
jgi:hypothetical protein